MMNKRVKAGGFARTTADDLRHVRAADLAETLSHLEPEAAAGALARMTEARAVIVLDRPEFLGASAAIAEMQPERAVPLVTAMSADRAADVLGEMDAERRDAILALLDRETRATLDGLLAYPPESAGGMMTTEFVSVPVTATVAGALDHIRTIERSRETIYSIYIVDPETDALVGTVSLRRLVTADPAQPVLELTRQRDPVVASPEMDRRAVARLIRRHDLLAVPVVDAEKRVLGIVTVDDVLDAIVDKHTEEAQRFGGVEALDRPYLDTSFLGMIRKRAGWLCALFLSEMLTASAMQHFESELAKAITLTLFIPLIMSSGGNSGSQATSLIIRALALGQVRLKDWWRVALRELPAGLVLGAILGAVGIARISAWQYLGFYDYGPHWPLIAATVGAGLVGIVTFGSLAGSMLPFLLQRLRFDPASASAPFVATLVDVTGLVIYFSIALVILSGTLL
ncbi:magnesium transporter [Sphingomonas oligoaromativorans]|uniref:magnesium transporter n=1 Tax=Sphingomonas oligoaromativorans TaxID=575322 RepID=UPI001423EF36|nr:magnesium transporter [Sphingomonas oligoaromativorans]NIJ35099.1 magnesium transporter [Sphingomonas oligoaromativorans]